MDIRLALAFCLFVMLASASEAAGALCNHNCTLSAQAGVTATRDEIDEYCSDWDTVKTCAQQHEAATGCTPSDDWVNTQALNDYVCSSESRQAYVDHGPCLFNQTRRNPHLEKCDIGSNFTCRSLSESLHCYERTFRVCGFFAARFYSTVISKQYTSHTTSSGCTPYEDEERQCDDDACRVPDLGENYKIEHINLFCSDWEITKACQRDQSSATGCNPTEGWINAEASFTYLCTPEGRQAFVDHGPCIGNDEIVSSEECSINSSFTCSEIHAALACFEDAYSEACGEDAARFLTTFYSKSITSVFTSKSCMPYRNSSPSTTPAMSVTLVTVTAAVITWLITIWM